MNIFSRNKEHSDPAIIIHNCLEFLLNRITDDLEREGYSWNKSWGVKRFEGIVLAKFIMDYSFERIVEDQLSVEEKDGYYELSNSSFSNIFNAEFSEIGMNFDDMQEEIEEKVEAYFNARREHRRSPECYYQIHMLMIGVQSRNELEEEVKKKTAMLEFMRTKENFAQLVTQFEFKINQLEQKIAAFDLSDIMLPHMFRSAKQKLIKINIKKIKVLSKKIAKQDLKK